MTSRAKRRLMNWLRDMSLGAAIFLLLPLLALTCQGQSPRWTFDDALAGELVASRAAEGLLPPAGPMTESMFAATAALRPEGLLLNASHYTDLAVLGFTFSLLVALNLAFFRHLRRVCASPRRGVWRRRSE